MFEISNRQQSSSKSQTLQVREIGLPSNYQKATQKNPAMKTSEYLDATKEVLGITSDNQLAKRLEINRSRISAYRAGREWPDNYIVTKIAITLNLDPAKVLADIECQREKNPKRAEFWKSLLSNATLAAMLMCTLTFSTSGISDSAAGAIGGLIAVSTTLVYALWIRII